MARYIDGFYNPIRRHSDARLPEPGPVRDGRPGVNKQLSTKPTQVQALPAGPLGLGQRWTVARKREVVLRLLRDEPVQLLSRQLGVEIFRLEQWREKAIGGIDASLKQRKGDPVQAELDSAMKRIGELTMQVELLEAKTETFGPLGRRRSRR